MPSVSSPGVKCPKRVMDLVQETLSIGGFLLTLWLSLPPRVGTGMCDHLLLRIATVSISTAPFFGSAAT